MVCPVSARHFGNLGDPQSDVSRMVASRGGADLLPELGYRPVNKYLPPRLDRMARPPPVAGRAAPPDDVSPGERLLCWVDRVSSR
jgi:sulfite dehydrogenase (quinone) subunit SoeB